MIGEPPPAAPPVHAPPPPREPARRGAPLALRLLLEFLTIVAGVLVALGVDQWVRGREDRALEHDYLLRLEQDLLADSLVNAEAVVTLDRKERGLVLLARMRAGEPLPDADVAELLPGLLYARVRGIPGARTRTTWDDLRSTGRLPLIRDPGVRAALDRYYAQIDRNEAILRNDFSEYPRAISVVLPGDLQRHVQLGEAISDSLLRRTLERLRSAPGLDPHIDAERGYGTVQRVMLNRVSVRADSALAVLRGAVR